MPAIEQGVSVQTDQLSTVPGGPIRTVTVWVPINGQNTPVQMQVVCMADSNGNIIDAPNDLRGAMSDILGVLKDLRTMVSKLADVPFVDSQEQSVDTPGTIS